MDIITAIILGTLFGFVLQRVGAADPDKIVGMLTLKDLHLMKAILAGIGFSSALLFIGLMIGFIDSGNLSVKTMYWGVIAGGVLLGAGWGLSGYCPGTGVVAAGSGRKDAFFFIIGGLVGAGLFTVRYGSMKGSFLLDKILGGKSTLVVTGESSALVEATWSPYIAIGVALVMLAVAKALPDKLC